jgi:RNA polymerase sigma-70 factor (ECF subfamily)
VGGVPDDLQDLVRRAQRGDDEAFSALVRLTQDDLFALALRLVGSRDDALDVLQEAYLRAYRHLGSFRGDAQVTTWLYRIVANSAASFLTRKRKFRTEVLDDGNALPDVRTVCDPEAMAGLSWEVSELARALAALPTRLRVVVVLRDVYDLPHEAIAAELGISRTAAKVRLHRARRRLREMLGLAEQDGSSPEEVAWHVV